MDNQFRAVPDGQYTQTIYSLVRDQKYTEVRDITHKSHIGNLIVDLRALILPKEPCSIVPPRALLLLHIRLRTVSGYVRLTDKVLPRGRLLQALSRVVPVQGRSVY